MNMEKAKLTSKQAEALKCAIEFHERHCNGHTSLIKAHINVLDGCCPFGKWHDETEALNDFSLDDLIVALYVGYEVEMTKEEKLLQFYKEMKEFDSQYSKGVVDGVISTLKILGIKIKGINA